MSVHSSSPEFKVPSTASLQKRQPSTTDAARNSMMTPGSAKTPCNISSAVDDDTPLLYRTKVKIGTVKEI